MTTSERRRFPRYPVQADVEVQWGFEVLPALCTDLSQGGMFIATTNPLWVGAAFTARLLLAEPLTLNCLVRRVLPGKGMGALFKDLSQETQARLDQLLQTIKEA